MVRQHWRELPVTYCFNEALVTMFNFKHNKEFTVVNGVSM